TVVAALRGGAPDEHCARLYPVDQVARALIRAVVSGGTTTTPGWAEELCGPATSSWLGSLAPASAAAALMKIGPLVPMDANGSIHIPVRASAPAALPWVGEGAPIPAQQGALTTATLSP